MVRAGANLAARRARLEWPPAGRWDSGGCDRSGSCSGWSGRTGRCRHGHRAPPSGTVQSRAWPRAGRLTCGGHTAPDTAARSGGRSRPAWSSHASGGTRLVKGTPHTGGGNRHRGSVRILPGTGPSWKEPERIAMGEPLAAEQGEGARGQRDIAVFEAFTTTYLELHAGTVDPANLEVDALADPQAAGIDGGETRVVGRVVKLIQNAPDLINAEDDR